MSKTVPPDSFSPRGGYPQEALKSTLSAAFSASFRNAPLVAAYCNGAPPCENLLENPCPESKYFTVKILQLVWAFLRKICFLKLPAGIFPSPKKKERQIRSFFFGDSKGIRTPVAAVRGLSLNRLTMEPYICFVSVQPRTRYVIRLIGKSYSARQLYNVIISARECPVFCNGK